MKSKAPTKPATKAPTKPAANVSANKPKVIAVFGARGTGKSAWIKQQLSKAQRLMVWDYMHEYQAQAKPINNLSEILLELKANKKWRLAYQVNHARQEAAFDMLCKMARAAKNCTLLAEELAFVTKANSAPPAWRQLTLLGRHAGVTVIGASQRPASVDKDFIACADVIHCGRLANVHDAKAVAVFLGVDWQELINLPDLHYIELDVTKRETKRGILTF